MSSIPSLAYVSSTYIISRVEELNPAGFGELKQQMKSLLTKVPEKPEWIDVFSLMHKNLLLKRAQECLQPLLTQPEAVWSKFNDGPAHLTKTCKKILSDKPFDWKFIVLVLEFVAGLIAKNLRPEHVDQFPVLLDILNRDFNLIKIHNNKTVTGWWKEKGWAFFQERVSQLLQQRSSSTPSTTPTTQKNLPPTIRNTAPSSATTRKPPSTSMGDSPSTTTGKPPSTSMGDSPSTTTGKSLSTTMKDFPPATKRDSPPATMGDSPPATIEDQVPRERGGLMHTQTASEYDSTAEQWDRKACWICGQINHFKPGIRLISCAEDTCKAWNCTIQDCEYTISPGFLSDVWEHMSDDHDFSIVASLCSICDTPKPKILSDQNHECTKCGWLMCSRTQCMFQSATLKELKDHRKQTLH